MAIIECKECKHNISDKASSCPNCGAPVSKTKQIKKDDYEEVIIKKEKTHPLTAIIYILFFIILIVVCLYDINFIKTFRNTYSLIAAESEGAFQSAAHIYSNIIINTIFISCILTSLSKRTFKISKIAFIINFIANVYFFYHIYSLNFRVDIQFFILYILNIIYLLLPRFNAIEETTKIVKKDKIKSIEEKNNKTEELHQKPIYTKPYKITILISIIISIITLITMIIINNQPIIHQTVIQDKTDFQIEITNDYINVRKEPSTSSTKIGEVNQSDIYNVLDVIGGDNYIWYKIKYQDNIGYISSNRQEPYVKELYKDELIVNVLCDNSSKCTNLHNKLKEYQKDNNTFLIYYVNIEENNNIELLNKLNNFFEEDAKVPYITIGTERIHTKNIYNRTTYYIKHPVDKEYNLVDMIKKGDNLPLLKQPIIDSDTEQ